jgi:hypothetical protein
MMENKIDAVSPNQISLTMHLLKSLILCSCLCLPFLAHGQIPSSHPQRKDAAMTMQAVGTFDVKTTLIGPDDATEGTGIGRYALVKQFHGDLEAQGKGEMLGAGDPAKGSAGYVAIEQVTGALHGRNGAFALQHTGTMDHAGYKLTITVVPGSGTGELAGISGTFIITIADGKHSYHFDYTLPAPAQ